MRIYEKDEVKLPLVFSWMSAEQLQKLSDIVYKFSKRAPKNSVRECKKFCVNPLD